MAAPVVFPPLDACRQRRSAKWTQYDADVLPMPVAELDCLLAEPIEHVLLEAIRRGDTGYPPMDGEPAAAFVDFARFAWGWDAAPEQSILCSDVSAGAIVALRTLLPTGSGVAISSPVYPPFHIWPKRAEMTLVEVPLLGPDQGWRLDLAGLERAFADGVRAYVLCHPHNPIGRNVPVEELAALADLADRYDVLVLADEIHAPLALPGHRFTPYLTVSDAARRTGVALHSPSKAWNLAGLKTAFLVYADDRYDAPLGKLAEKLPWQAGSLGALAAVPAYREGRDWLASLVEYLAGNHALLRAELAAKLPEARCWLSEAQAGYLAWVDVSAYGYGDEPAKRILDVGRLALGVGTTFGEPGAGHVRINVGCARDLIPQAVDRMVAALP